MEDDNFLVATKFALIEAIMAATDPDLLDLITKILIIENENQRAQTPQAG